MPFRDISGHAPLRTLIKTAALRGTLPPSLIFAGPAGVGKHMTAVALAQLVNCAQPVDGDACGQCQSCRRIARRVHADTLYVEPGDTGAIKIEQIRDVVEKSGYRPFEGRRRFILIDQADAMAGPAQDALLKTLEEPPNSTTFVLITASPGTLLPTILSRCQRLRFGRLSPADVADVLMRSHDFEAADAHAAAAMSDGSIGRALEGATDAFVEARTAAMQLLEIVAGDPPPARRLQGSVGLPGAGRGKADRDALAQSLAALGSLLRDLGVLLAQADPRALANADMQPALQRVLRGFDAERILRAFRAVDKATDALGRNASPKIVADWLVFQI
jgi:DNA polymerase-3 subunit delta'